jgi:hypothetical protein
MPQVDYFPAVLLGCQCSGRNKPWDGLPSFPYAVGYIGECPELETASGPLRTQSVDVPAVTAYFATTPRDPAWKAVPAADQAIYVQEALRWLQALCPEFHDNCCVAFDDAWLRAVAELALALSANPTVLIGGGATAAGPTGEVKRQKLGDLEIEFFQARAGEAVSTGSRYGPKAPLVLQRFPWLGDILGCWLPSYGSGGRIVPRWRS